MQTDWLTDSFENRDAYLSFPLDILIAAKKKQQNQVVKTIYYIDIDEIPGFLLLLKNHIFTARSERIIFIFHMWGYSCRHGNEHD